MKKPLVFAAAILVVLTLTSCSQDQEEPAAVESSQEMLTPTPEETPVDPCLVVAQMEGTLSIAVADFIADPQQDALASLEATFNAEIVLLSQLIDSVGMDPARLDAVIASKDLALSKLTEANASDNFLQKGISLAAAASSAQDAVTSSQEILSELNAQLDCP
jgi:hypothetical protein